MVIKEVVNMIFKAVTSQKFKVVYIITKIGT